ncbi:hypothetical protein D9M69_581380 [compost metagenome]
MPSSVWPRMMVSWPRCGQPKKFCAPTAKSSSDRPMITSGITSGALTMPEKMVRPMKRR